MWFFCLEKGNLFKHESKKVKNCIDFYVKQGSWKSILKQNKRDRSQRRGERRRSALVSPRPTTTCTRMRTCWLWIKKNASVFYLLVSFLPHLHTIHHTHTQPTTHTHTHNTHAHIHKAEEESSLLLISFFRIFYRLFHLAFTCPNWDME